MKTIPYMDSCDSNTSLLTVVYNYSRHSSYKYPCYLESTPEQYRFLFPYLIPYHYLETETSQEAINIDKATKEFLDKIIKTWQPYFWQRLTYGDAEEINTNLTDLFLYLEKLYLKYIHKN